ncbi:aldehyde dehydrogenase family protein [Pseudomonas sp. PB3P13]
MFDKIYIDGQWVDGGGDVWDVVCPVTEEVIQRLRLGSETDMENAIEAASKAFPLWASLQPVERANYLRKIAQGVEDNKGLLIDLQMRNSGKPFAEAEIDVNAVIETFTYYSKLISANPSSQIVDIGVPGFSGEITQEPIGVAGLISPWNFPMVTTSWKLAPALAAGCTVVVKPSEFTPLAEMALASIIDKVGLPRGVVNYVPGLGDVVGKKLVEDVRVKKISFTGSGAVGKEIMRSAADTVKKISLELGGKSPILVFEDADVEEAIELVIAGIFYNAGQICSATSRLLIAETISHEFIERLLVRCGQITVGAPSEEAQMGPLVSKAHFDRVRNAVEHGLGLPGAFVRAGGKPVGNNSGRGYFYQPTVIEINDPKHVLWREEIFGPVLCFMKFSSEEEGIALANDSVYGLAATVATSCANRARRVARKLEAGFVTVNSPQIVSPRLSWGGYKESSLGRELGVYGLSSFQEVKSTLFKI